MLLVQLVCDHTEGGWSTAEGSSNIKRVVVLSNIHIVRGKTEAQNITFVVLYLVYAYMLRIREEQSEKYIAHKIKRPMYVLCET